MPASERPGTGLSGRWDRRQIRSSAGPRLNAAVYRV
jgi:hypothetical protein